MEMFCWWICFTKSSKKNWYVGRFKIIHFFTPQRKILSCRNEQEKNSSNGCRWQAVCCFCMFTLWCAWEPNRGKYGKTEKKKHPTQVFPSPVPLPEDCIQICVSPELVLKKLRAFPKGSAAGPTGIRASHILNAIQVHNQNSALLILTDFVNHLAKSMASKDVQPFLSGAFLIGIGKKDGGIRPIAIGDVFRRLVGKCLASVIL